MIRKGSIPTKYGDKAQLLAAIDALKRNDIAVLLDVVVNHKMGADEKEAIRVQRVNADDRTQIDEEIIECEGWTRYTFPARAGQYSQFIWDFKCFSGIDHIEHPDEDGIFLKLLTTIPEKAGTIRLMMNSVISII